jgi:hypothetical protein
VRSISYYFKINVTQLVQTDTTLIFQYPTAHVMLVIQFAKAVKKMKINALHVNFLFIYTKTLALIVQKAIILT